MHWSLYIEADKDEDKTIIHDLGACQRYFPDIRTPSDARLSASLVEICPLCNVDVSKIEALKNIAYATPIRNDEAGYSCQDYVHDILDRLEDNLIIDPTDGAYERNKRLVAGKREAWS
ncbi:hypothetical protein BJX64DRAFT_249003 [Aspergillus heterothallicus]